MSYQSGPEFAARYEPVVKPDQLLTNGFSDICHVPPEEEDPTASLLDVHDQQLHEGAQDV